jgi:hypothetical protein
VPIQPQSPSSRPTPRPTALGHPQPSSRRLPVSPLANDAVAGSVGRIHDLELIDGPSSGGFGSTRPPRQPRIGPTIRSGIRNGLASLTAMPRRHTPRVVRVGAHPPTLCDPKPRTVRCGGLPKPHPDQGCSFPVRRRRRPPPQSPDPLGQPAREARARCRPCAPATTNGHPGPTADRGIRAGLCRPARRCGTAVRR